MTNEEINKIASRKYPIRTCDSESEIIRVTALREAFIEGMKTMQKQYRRTSAWIAVDESGQFVLSGEKPTRYKLGWWVDVTPIEKGVKIKNMSWKNEPQKIEILLKK